MEFRDIISIMTYLSLGFISIEIYLSLNKLWKRKHEKVVAESISIGAKLVSLVPSLIFTIDFLLSKKWAGFASYMLFIFSVMVHIAVGSGIWVTGMRKKGFWTLFGQSLENESKEVGHLAKSLFHPSHANLLMEILVRVAQIDNYLDKREKEFIESFAETWNISFNWQDYEYIKQENDLDKIRNCVAEYLQTTPPIKQAQQLFDVLKMLVEIDQNISDNEATIMEEIGGLIGNYVDKTDETHIFQVAVVPQNDQQEDAIRSLLPKAKRQKVAGGYAYVVGCFYSQRYAEIICNQYRAFNFFSVAVLYNMTEKTVEKELVSA